MALFFGMTIQGGGEIRGRLTGYQTWVFRVNNNLNFPGCAGACGMRGSVQRDGKNLRGNIGMVSEANSNTTGGIRS